VKVLHFDCFAGISGDMALGALVDLGVDPDTLREELGKLGLEGWKLTFTRDERCGIGGTRAFVDLGDRHDHRDHGHEHHHEHEHHHDHEHDHHHHDDEHHHDHEHSHNSWKEIRGLIENSAIREGAKKRALDIFSRIAGAEAQVHGVAAEEVTFHEVGAMDSIIDIVGTAICLDLLQPDRVTASEVELGGGTVRCAHGELPVPAPATLILCRGMPVRTGGFRKEMTTPTGAGILASSVDEFIDGGSFVELKTGYGVGERKLDKPNLLRVSWREVSGNSTGAGDGGEREPWKVEELTVMEANIDDMSGEALGFLMERLFAQGALDVSFTPCTMKKSRPGTLVTVLSAPEKLDALRRTMFQRSASIGFREHRVRRLSLRREENRITGNFGEARVKRVFFGDRELRSKIEYEDRARLAREREISLEEAERLITEEGLHG
jgi:uncharacterized protein (TIGR00299 family) protein